MFSILSNIIYTVCICKFFAAVISTLSPWLFCCCPMETFACWKLRQTAGTRITQWLICGFMTTAIGCVPELLPNMGGPVPCPNTIYFESQIKPSQTSQGPSYFEIVYMYDYKSELFSVFQTLIVKGRIENNEFALQARPKIGKLTMLSSRWRFDPN